MKNSACRFLQACLLALACALVSSVQAAGPDASEFVKHPRLTDVSLSPDGKALAGVRFVEQRRNLLVVDLATRKATIITNFRDGDVIRATWISPKRLVFSVTDLSRGSGEQDAGGLYAIDKDGEEFRQLAERSGTTEKQRMLPGGTEFHSRIYVNGVPSDDILVSVPSMQAQGRFAANLYRVNTRSGVSSIASLGGPGQVLKWVVDKDAIPRAAVSVDEGVTRVYFRETEKAPWRVVSEFNIEQRSKGLDPIAFDGDGQLYVSSYAGKDTEAIYRFDAATGAIKGEPVVAATGFDVNAEYSQFIFDGKRDKLLGIRYEGEKRVTIWFDPAIAQLQRQVDAALPATVNLLSSSFTSPDDPILVGAYSDRNPGTFLLYSQSKKALEQIAVSRPGIDPKRMAETKFVRYKARDGLSIPALLTLPPGSTGKNLPLVVMHYGGPQVRAIRWGWDANVQFLASRGYAVLMPAPRMSTGYGWKHFQSGWKQWGLAMQDDITDGAQWLIGEGTVDPKRVCIAGASYGGYAAMMGLVKEPALFKCGVNWVGVAEPEYMFTVTWTDFNRVDAARYDLPVLIGDPKKLSEQFRRTSPLQRAEEIKQPVLMAYGGRDQRVPIVNGERLRDALAKHNPNVEWVVYNDEGHGWLKEENNIDFWNRVATFLDRYLLPN